MLFGGDSMTLRHLSGLIARLVVLYLYCAGSAAQSHAPQIRGPLPPATIVGGQIVSLTPPGVRASVTSLGPFGYAVHPPSCCGVNNAERHLDDNGVGAVVIVPEEDSSYLVRYQGPETLESDASSTAVRSPRGSSAGMGEFRERLNALEDRLRELESANDITAYSANSSPPPPPELLSTILVLRDGSSIEVKNYVIDRDAVYTYLNGSERKIDIDSLDLVKTQKRNEERGLEFRLPIRRNESGEASGKV